jgi:hypothetical protein
MSEEGYYSNIIEVAEAKSAEEANALLKTGYELLKIAEKTIVREDGSAVQGPLYILGKRRGSGSLEVDPQLLEKLPFKPYKEGSSAGWIWADPEKHESQVKDIVAWLRGKIEREKKVTIGKFYYMFSGPEDNPQMFISRRPVEGE